MKRGSIVQNLLAMFVRVYVGSSQNRIGCSRRSYRFDKIWTSNTSDERE